MATAWADVSITYEALEPLNKDLSAGAATKIMASKNALITDIGSLYSMIYIGVNFFFLLDNKERPFIDVGAAIKEMERMRKEIEKKLVRLPPEQRKMAEAMMGVRWNMRISETEPCEDPKAKALSLPHQMFEGIGFSSQPTKKRVVKLSYKYPFVVKAAKVKAVKEEPYLILRERKTEKAS